MQLSFTCRIKCITRHYPVYLTYSEGKWKLLETLTLMNLIVSKNGVIFKKQASESRFGLSI
jgi:hypothetical protein